MITAVWRSWETCQQIALVVGNVNAVIRKRVVVSGLVQGVFFRDTCRRAALAAGVSGWVRNLGDGSVEAVFQGSPAAVEAMVEWARRGPSRARVERVRVHDEVPEPMNGFEIRRSEWTSP
jgi:acylphosphatase